MSLVNNLQTIIDKFQKAAEEAKATIPEPVAVVPAPVPPETVAAPVVAVVETPVAVVEAPAVVEPKAPEVDGELMDAIHGAWAVINSIFKGHKTINDVISDEVMASINPQTEWSKAQNDKDNPDSVFYRDGR